MGLSISCPFSDSDDLEKGVELESVIVRSISFGDKELKTMVRSISFKRQDSDPTIMKRLGSGKMIVEGSVSFKRREMDTMISISASSANEEKSKDITPICTKSNEMDNSFQEVPKLSLLDSNNSKNEAAVRLQKVYKSFRTRRKLADCAVLVEELEQSWWNLLDSAELKHSSISFFDIKNHETASSRWLRARTRAAKVGKGLSKNDNAKKLAFQHWLEAIDPRHRYGHNLHFYYRQWQFSQSREPFFYWLDIGEGKEVNLEKCPRLKLQQQCIKYLGPMERKAYEVVIVDGKFLYKQTGKALDTSGQPKDAKWIFVLSTTKALYVGQKKKGTFQHSSFLAGAATSAAGRLIVEDGTLKAVWPHSGHYQPTRENFRDFISFLEENNVNIAHVKMTPVDEDGASFSRQKSTCCLRNNFSEEDLTKTMNVLEMGEINTEDWNSLECTSADAFRLPKPIKSSSLIANCPTAKEAHSSKGYIASEMNVYEEDQDKQSIPGQSIIHNQMGKKLSRTWTTGAGPRISCVRDCPSALQYRALEQVNLSPRSATFVRSDSSLRSDQYPEVSMPATFYRGTERISSPLCFEKGSLTQTDLRTQPSALRRGTSVAADFSHS